MQSLRKSLRVVPHFFRGAARRLFAWWGGSLLLCLLGLWPGQVQAFRLLMSSGQPQVLQADLLVPAGDTLYLAPGTVLHLADSARLVVKGTLYALGTPNFPVRVAPAPGAKNWGKLILQGEGAAATLRHVHLDGIRIETLKADLFMQFVEFRRRRPLKMSDATLLFRRGRLLVDQCRLIGNGTGEGLIIIKPEPHAKVQNSYFERVADAVEFITADSLLISGNRILGKDNVDDGIDLNDCRMARIAFNYVAGYKNRGVEIGHDNFGSCRDILLFGNVIRNCAEGVMVKEGSDAEVKTCILENNGYGIRVAELGEGRGPGMVSMRNCWFKGTPVPAVLDAQDGGQIRAGWRWLIGAS